MPHIATAQAYPTQPVRVVVGVAAGGSTDILARLMAQWLSERLGQQFFVENRPGGGTNVATEAVVNSPPDGYTLVFAATSSSINASLYSRLPFNFIRDIAPVAGVVRVPNVVVVSPALPVKTLAEFLAYAKANPAKVNMASAGIGTTPHMSGELFKTMAGLDMTHIPYKGSTLAHPDLRGGITSLMFDTVAAISPLVKGGGVRALAVTTAKRSAAAPDVPTMAEAGLDGYETSTWGGVLAPAGTPKEVVAKLNAEINKALAAPDVSAKLTGAGIEVAGGTPEQFAAFIQAEMQKWAKVAKDAGIVPE